jgi:3-methyladenine DNA glycosylase/8-oxoguanine DNA glycosylase
MTASGADDGRMVFRDDRDHRYTDQVAFLARFPAYTTESTDHGVALWYREGSTIRVLRLSPTDGGVVAEGDQATARRILRAHLSGLLPRDALPHEPAAHRLLYDRHAGVRPVLFADPFEGIAWTILGQQITVTLAVRLKRALSRHLGTVREGIAGPVSIFPSPEVMAGASVEGLRALSLSRQKAATLIAVARAIADGRWNPAALSDEPVESARAVLEQFRGIGRWTAEYILLRVAGHADVLPAGDVGLQRAWARLTGQPARVTETVLREAGEAWRGWRSDFAFYLWRDNLLIRDTAPIRRDKRRGGW